jgi:EAL domain-containing protein (putative c-di-GMP-specific phosphodiesterase class I)
MAHVLLADGNTHMRDTLARVLTTAGFVADGVGTPAEALQRLGDVRVDVLVASDELGEEAAAELLRAARVQFPGVMRLLHVGPGGNFGDVSLAEGTAHRLLRRPFQVETLESELRGLEETAAHVRSAMLRAGDHQTHARLFQECLDEDLLGLAMQPIVRPGERAPVAVELLLRSQHPRLHGPLAVLDAVERCARVPDLGDHVNRLAVAWLRRLPASVAVFVNTHPAQFADPGVLKSFAPLEPWAGRVVLEITERAPLQDFQGAEAVLAELTRRGFRIAVDDIGSGYNSLAVLAELQPAFIKADMSIVRNVDREARKQRLLQLLASFASATGAELIAEGVETEAEEQASARCGAHLIQGFHVGRPTLEQPTAA